MKIPKRQGEQWGGGGGRLSWEQKLQEGSKVLIIGGCEKLTEWQKRDGWRLAPEKAVTVNIDPESGANIIADALNPEGIKSVLRLLGGHFFSEIIFQHVGHAGLNKGETDLYIWAFGEFMSLLAQGGRIVYLSFKEKTPLSFSCKEGPVKAWQVLMPASLN